MYRGYNDNRVLRLIILVVMNGYLLLVLPSLGQIFRAYCEKDRKTVNILECVLHVVNPGGEKDLGRKWISYNNATKKCILEGLHPKGAYSVCWFSSTNGLIPEIARLYIRGLYTIIVNIRYGLELLKPINKTGPS